MYCEQMEMVSKKKKMITHNMFTYAPLRRNLTSNTQRAYSNKTVNYNSHSNTPTTAATVTRHQNPPNTHQATMVKKAGEHAFSSLQQLFKANA
jgi:hypothetical protein